MAPAGRPDLNLDGSRAPGVVRRLAVAVDERDVSGVTPQDRRQRKPFSALAREERGPLRRHVTSRHAAGEQELPRNAGTGEDPRRHA